MNQPKREVRFISKSELRAAGDAAKMVIEGYAAVFDAPAELYREPGYSVTEVIRKGAFTRTLSEGADVRCLFNHDDNIVLGRSKSKTMEMRQDDHGLFYSCELPATTAARDLYESIKRGDVDQCSFSFYAAGQKRTSETDADGNVTILRELLDLDLFDVSPVTYPAYPQTSVAARAAEVAAECADIVKEEKQARTAAVTVDASDWRTRAEMRLAIADRE
jgi:HK97 family phage prohead protease